MDCCSGVLGAGPLACRHGLQRAEQHLPAVAHHLLFRVPIPGQQPGRAHVGHGAHERQAEDAVIGAQVGINGWNRLFFDALESKDMGAVITAIGLLPLLLAQLRGNPPLRLAVNQLCFAIGLTIRSLLSRVLAF